MKNINIIRKRARKRVSGLVPPFEWAPNLPSGLTLYGDTYPLGNFTGNNVARDGFTFGGDARIPDGDPIPALGTVLGSHTVTTTSGLWRNMPSEVGPHGTGCTDFAYPEGAGNGGNNVFFYTASNRNWVRMYVSVALYFSPDYLWHFNTQKGLYPVIITPGFANRRTNIGIETNGTGETPAGPTAGFSWNSQLTDGSPFSEWSLDQSTGNSVRLRKGQWHNLEIYAQMNTPGNADGVIRIWLDGSLAMDDSGRRYNDAAFTSQGTFNSAVISGTRGGGPNNVSNPPEGIFMRFNRFAAYGSETF